MPFIELRRADEGTTVKYVPAWMPGAGFQKKAGAWKKSVLEMRDAPFEAVQKALVSAKLFMNFKSVLSECNMRWREQHLHASFPTC